MSTGIFDFTEQLLGELYGEIGPSLPAFLGLQHNA